MGIFINIDRCVFLYWTIISHCTVWLEYTDGLSASNEDLGCSHFFAIFKNSQKKPLSILICVPAQLPAWYKCLEMALLSGWYTSFTEVLSV